MDYVHSFESFLKKMIDPGEDYPADEKPVLRIDDFKNIFSLVRSDNITDNVSYSNKTLLFLKVLKSLAYYIIDEETVSSLFKASLSKLN
jgi:hypothetical protein